MTSSLLRSTVIMLGLLAGGVAPHGPPMLPVGWAVNAIGTLTIIRADGVEEQLQGRKTMPLYEGDVLKTDASSQAYIQLETRRQRGAERRNLVQDSLPLAKDKPTTWILRLSQGEVWAKTAGDGPKAFESKPRGHRPSKRRNSI